MNIKEIEERSGLTRANIRYYEQEGLIAPVRRENKYPNIVTPFTFDAS